MITMHDVDLVSHTDDSKIEMLENSARDSYLSEYVISIKEEKEYCVGKVKMLNSNKITASIGLQKAVKYHQLFLNSISYVLERFGGYVIKNVDSSLLYYFPESGKNDRRFGFMSCIECGLAMVQIHEEMCKNAVDLELPRINYSITADYGKVTVINVNGSKRVDLLGSPMDACSKMIHNASSSSSNEFIIGEDLYKIIKNYNDYNFKEITNHPNKYDYDKPVYTVTRNHR